MIRTEIRGDLHVLRTDAERLAERLKSGKAPVHAAIGHRMALTRVPQALRKNVDGWPTPRSFPRAYRAGGQPLLDTRRLSSSLAYKATERDVKIGTNVEYGRILRHGGTIRPRTKKRLLEPLSPPLTISEVRAFPKGKDAIKARYPKSFFLAKGPDGPGIYRAVRGKAGVKTKKFGNRKRGQISASWVRHEHEGKTIERIAAAMKKVRIRRYNWLRWRPEDIEDSKKQIVAWLRSGKLPGYPLTAGDASGRKVANA